MSDPFFMDDMMFNIVPVFIAIIFVIVIGGFIFSAVKGVGQWKSNEQSPKLTVPAVVKSRRTDISRRGHLHNDHHHSHTHTRYFITFEFESGDRSEFQVSGKEYGLLSEDDIGTLTFQGTRYLGFERES